MHHGFAHIRAQHLVVVPNADFPRVLGIERSGPRTVVVDRAGDVCVNHDVVYIEKTKDLALLREEPADFRRCRFRDVDVVAQGFSALLDHEAQAHIRESVVPIPTANVAVDSREPHFRDSVGILFVPVDERRFEGHPVLVQRDDVHGAAYAGIQGSIFEYDIAADRFALPVDPVHGRHGIEDAQECDFQLGIRIEAVARKLSRQRRAATEPEHNDAVIRRGRQFLQVSGRLLQDSSRVPPARRQHAVDKPSRRHDEFADEGDGLPILPSPDAVLVQGFLRLTGRRKRLAPVFLHAAAHEHVELQDVADTLVLLEAAGVPGFVSGANTKVRAAVEFICGLSIPCANEAGHLTCLRIECIHWRMGLRVIHTDCSAHSLVTAVLLSSEYAKSPMLFFDDVRPL